MNFVEAMELLRALSAFLPKSLRVRPKFTFYDAEKEGYVVYVKEDAVLSDYVSYVNEIVKARDLRIRKQEGFLVIHSQ